ncbi:MAG: tetratricopeptide repeat protein [Phycisphaerae bacterium]|jgi:tetratricopeptide (TPR) repeat protein
MNNRFTKYRGILICLSLAIVTFAVFYQMHRFKFITFDDPDYVFENRNIQAGITPETVKWAFTTSHAANWHPVTWLSHMLDWRLFGSNAGGHHLTSLIFHIANTLLLFIVLYQMTSATWQSAFVAAMFALHPMHVESVAWVSERKDVLSTFFGMLTMLAYLRYAKKPGIVRYMLIVLTFALGLMSKPMLVTLPFVLLLLDYWPLSRLGSKRSLFYLIVEKIPLFVMVFVSCTVTFIFQKQGGAMSGKRYDFLVRFANAIISYIQYIIKMIWPVRLSYFYSHPGENISVLYAVTAAVILLTVTILILRLAGKHKYLVTGWFWYIGTLAPVIGFVQVGAQAMADRYSYITLTGLFIMIAWGLPELLGKWKYKKNVLVSFAILIIFAMSICTWFQLGYWADSKTLYQHALDVTTDNYTANIHMSESMREQGNLDDSLYYCSQAIRIMPGAVRGHLRMGYLLRQAGRLDESAREYQKCLQARPNDSNALNGLGATLSRQGKYDQAVECLAKALRIRPSYAAAHDNMGHVLAIQGKLDEAVVHLNEALRLNPDFALAHYHLGQVQMQRGEINEAVAHFDEALKLNPDWFEPMNGLSWLLAVSKNNTVHNPDKAVNLAMRACELTDYKNPEILDTLAVAYAATGDFDKAVETVQKALELCKSSKQEDLKKEIENRLALYKAGEPYVEN